MHCIDDERRRGTLAALFGTLWLAACGTRQPAPPPADSSPPPPPPRPAPPPPPVVAAPPPAPAAPAPAPGPGGRPPRYVPLGPPSTPRNADELRLQAARRLVAAHPDTTYMGKPQPLLLAIPVIEVELNADGSIRGINVLRRPGQAQDTVQIAIDAIRRAAPYGDVSRLPRPWKFVETFLFNDDRRFKPRTLDP